MKFKRTLRRVCNYIQGRTATPRSKSRETSSRARVKNYRGQYSLLDHGKLNGTIIYHRHVGT